MALLSVQSPEGWRQITKCNSRQEVLRRMKEDKRPTDKYSTDKRPTQQEERVTKEKNR